MMGVRQGFEFIQGSLTVYTCVKCPIVGQKFCVNAPSKAPLRPEGGVVEEYIDRYIIYIGFDLDWDFNVEVSVPALNQPAQLSPSSPVETRSHRDDERDSMTEDG